MDCIIIVYAKQTIFQKFAFHVIKNKSNVITRASITH